MQLSLFSSSETTDLKEGFSLEAIFEAYFSCRSNKRNTINALAFASPLKLPSAGYRMSDGAVVNVNSLGAYWSSTVNSTNSSYLRFDNTTATTPASYRLAGRSVRCIKN
jgi:hypothetical protein